MSSQEASELEIDGLMEMCIIIDSDKLYWNKNEPEKGALSGSQSTIVKKQTGVPCNKIYIYYMWVIWVQFKHQEVTANSHFQYFYFFTYTIVFKIWRFLFIQY